MFGVAYPLGRGSYPHRHMSSSFHETVTWNQLPRSEDMSTVSVFAVFVKQFGNLEGQGQNQHAEDKTNEVNTT